MFADNESSSRDEAASLRGAAAFSLIANDVIQTVADDIPVHMINVSRVSYIWTLARLSLP